MSDYRSDNAITATELKKNLGKYLDYAADNHEIVITKNGKPSVKLTPYVDKFSRYLTINESLPKYSAPKRVSYAEFLEISETFEGRMEYINGEIVMHNAPSAFHQEVVGNLYVFLRQFFKNNPCKVFLAPFDVTLYKEGIDDPDVFQPDLLVACDAKETINDKGRYSGIPTLVIEVLSPSTKRYDLTSKLRTYLEGGCKEYWVVDPIKKTLIQYGFKDLDVELYENYKINDSFNSYAFSELLVDMKEVFEE